MSVNYTEIINHYEYILLDYHYKNADKLKVLLSFWLKIYNYSKNNNIIFPNNSLNIFEQVLIQEGININKQQHPSKSFKKTTLFYILSKIPQHKGILQCGLLTRFNKLRPLITLAKLYGKNHEINKKLFIDFKKKFLGNSDYELLISKIPICFFFGILKIKSFPKIIETVPLSLFRESYFKTLLLDKKIYIHGYQHGGGYGEIHGNKLECFDLDISDQYFYWGLGLSNKEQNRFRHETVQLNKIESLYLVGTQDWTGIYSYFIDFNIKNSLSTEKNRIKLFNYTSKDKIDLIYLKSPKSNNNEFSSYPSSTLSNITKCKKKKSLFILDYPMHTFFYEAIYSSFPFILFFDRSWSISFTENYINMLKILREHRILYYWNEIDLFIERINFLKENVYPFQAITTLRKYLNNN